MPTDIESAGAGILKAVLSIGCAALIVLACVVGLIVTLVKVWR